MDKTLNASEQEQATLDLIQKRRDACYDARADEEGRWYRAVAFLEGRQWVYWNDILRDLDKMPSLYPVGDPRRIRLTIDKIMPAVRHLIGIISGRAQQFEAVPAQAEEGDRDKTRAAQEVLEWYNTDPRVALKNKLHKFTEWGVTVGGGGWIKAVWDKELEYYDKSGDIRFEVHGPFNFYYDPTVDDPQDSSYFIEEMVLDRDECIARWPDKKEFLRADATEVQSAETGVFPHRTHALSDPGMSNSDETLKDKVLVRVYWEKKSRNYEKGRLIFATKRTILKESDMPKGYKLYPYFRFLYLPKLDNGISGITPVEAAIPLQVEYNMLRSQIQQCTRLVIHTKLLLHEDSGANIEDMHCLSGEDFLWGGDAAYKKPEWMVPPSLPAQIWQQMATVEKDLQDIFAIHDPSVGVAPKNVESGVGIESLQEKDVSAQTPAITAFENVVCQIGQHILSLVKAYWSGKRWVRVMGDSYEWEAKQIQASDLGENLDVRLKPKSDMPDTRAARRQFLIQLNQHGFFKQEVMANPQVHQFINRMLDMGATGADFYQEQRLHENKAKKESQEILTDESVLMKDPRTGFVAGSTVQVHAFDNDAVHIAQHTRDALSKSFEDASPDAQQALQIHIIVHQAATVPFEQMQAVLEGGMAQQGLLSNIGQKGIQMPQTNLQPGAAGAGQPQPPAMQAVAPTSMAMPQSVPGGGQPPPANPLM